jgi:hypothetical protein
VCFQWACGHAENAGVHWREWLSGTGQMLIVLMNGLF